MSGLFDRVNGAGLDGRGGDRVNGHLLNESLCAYVGNTFTRNQVVDVLNSQLTQNGSQPLRAEDLTDIDEIVAVADGKSTTTAKLVYAVTVVSPVMTAAELEEIPEANWRGALEIP